MLMFMPAAGPLKYDYTKKQVILVFSIWRQFCIADYYIS